MSKIKKYKPSGILYGAQKHRRSGKRLLIQETVVSVGRDYVYFTDYSDKRATLIKPETGFPQLGERVAYDNKFDYYHSNESRDAGLLKNQQILEIQSATLRHQSAQTISTIAKMLGISDKLKEG